MNTPLGYEAIKALAAETGCNMKDLIVLARNNDPFFCGTMAHVRDAEWFAAWWRRLGYEGSRGVHLRAIRYRLVSQDILPITPSDLPYINTLECWSYLGAASKMARHLGMVDVEAFTDRRNPNPQIHAWGTFYPTEPALKLEQWDDWSLPSIFLFSGDLSLPEFSVTKYTYSPAQQPYQLEVWIEKSTMDDVLLPICRRHHVNLVTSVGFQSIPSAVALLRRGEEQCKPTRVFYVSDFDPAGAFMPDAVARQIEFWRYQLGIDIEIKLHPIALTKEQVIEYQLPSIPIKETDRRSTGFESRYGMLATELDALEALHPGTLAALVEEAIEPYRDHELEERWEEAQEEAEEVARKATEWVVSETLDEWHAIRNEVRAIQEGYWGRVKALNAEMQQELAPYRERMQAVRRAIQQAIDQVDKVFELPELPEPELEDPDEDDWLLDSNRTYLEQLDRYKARRGALAEKQP